MSAKRPSLGIRPLFDHRGLDGIRSGVGDADNALLDEWAAGRVDRRTFLRQASVLGVLPLLSGVAALMDAGYSRAGGDVQAAGVGGAGAGGAGAGTVRVGVAMP